MQGKAEQGVCRQVECMLKGNSKLMRQRTTYVCVCLGGGAVEGRERKHTLVDSRDNSGTFTPETAHNTRLSPGYCTTPAIQQKDGDTSSKDHAGLCADTSAKPQTPQSQCR